CETFGALRAGPASVIKGAFQRLGVSPDGSTIAFEITDDFAGIETNSLPAEQKGIFIADADGQKLHRLRDASRQPWFRFTPDFSEVAISPGFPGIAFSPDGTLIAFTDIGKTPTGEDAIQVFSHRLSDGMEKQLTCLPITPPVPFVLDIVGPLFVDNETVAFA